MSSAYAPAYVGRPAMGQSANKCLSLLEVHIAAGSLTLSAESTRSFSIQVMSDFACGTINECQHRGVVILC